MSQTHKPQEEICTSPTTSQTELELVPGVTFQPAMSPTDYHQFREFWHQEVYPKIVEMSKVHHG